MNINEMIMIAMGAMISIIAFFIKKEKARVENLSRKLRHIEIDLAKNGARDSERWIQTQKLLEDRRTDVVRIFEKLEK
tara:strand:+ start:318 stop:551 length:234 start_codon:yes stop_codon:yes gene_type:complete